jgi:orotidine-5'-phosphate decarboxylase
MIMKEQVQARFLKLALDLMNDQQLKHFEFDLQERMDYLKTFLIEQVGSEEAAEIVREEYKTLKEIRSKFVVDLNSIG